MKRKSLIIFLITIIIITLGNVCSLAVEANIEMNIQGNTTVTEEEKTIEITMSLGSFTGIEEGQPLGYQGKIQYDENIIASISVEGLNGWKASYEESTKTLLGETDVANSNTNIAKITVTLKEDLKPNTTGNIQFEEILLTDGTNDFTFNKTLTITVEGTEDSSEDEDNSLENETGNENVIENENTTGNTEENNNKVTNTETIKTNNIDKTTASTKLPAAGLKNILIISIFILVIITIIAKIKSKSIKY